MYNMVRNILFDNSMIKQMEKDYSRTTLHKDQRNLVEQSAKVYVQYIPVSELAMRGFLSRAIAQWQEEHKKTIDQIHNAPKNVKIGALNEIMGKHLIELMTRIVVKPEQVGLLENAIKEVSEMVIKNM